MTVLEMLFAVGSGLVSINVAILFWWGKRVTEKVDRLTMHREDCIRQFADRIENAASHKRLWDAVEELREKQRTQ